MNITQVAPGIYRGPDPQSPADWQQLVALGIKFDLDLQTGTDFPVDDGELKQDDLTASSYGIKTFNRPMGEFFAPTTLELSNNLQIIEANQPIYIHCLAGVDRTGMQCAWYRMKVQGWSKAQAVAEMKAMGMHFWYFYWVWSL